MSLITKKFDKKKKLCKNKCSFNKINIIIGNNSYFEDKKPWKQKLVAKIY